MTRNPIVLAATALLTACGQPADKSPTEPSPPTGPPAASAQSGSGVGVVTALDPVGTVTIDHSAIPAVGWPAMTMTFAASPTVLQNAAVGERIEFDLTVQGSAAEITAIRPE